MFSFKPRHALPAAAVLASVMFLANAVPHVTPPAAAPGTPAALALLRADVQDCVARTGRTHDECLDEAEGKALIQRAEQLAGSQAGRGASRGDELADEIDAATPAHRSRSSLQ